MTEFNYNQIIEYIDGTYDENFNNAKKWALSHNTSFEEDLEKRDLPKRYFVIGEESKVYISTDNELKSNVRLVRNQYLAETDVKMLSDYPISRTEKQYVKDYRQYLREYTNQENWWEQNPLNFDEWKEIDKK